MINKYLGVAYVTPANPKLEVMHFESLDGVREFLARPANYGHKWTILEIAQKLPYKSETVVTLLEGER